MRRPTESWAGRPRVAVSVRLAYLVVPLLAAMATSALLVRLPAVRDAPFVGRWVLVLAAASAVTVVVHRSLARLVPLAGLLELSVQFPGPAPSRYAVARDAGDPRKLAETVARAQRGDPLVNLADAEAARDILALVAALRSHDARTRGHSERVRVYTDLIAQQLHLPGADREQLRWAALLHDVGKLNVPAAVLNKTEQLDDRDWTLLRGHPTAGAEITAPLRSWLGEWSDTIAQHHEKYDGTGYPLGLSGDSIALGARIVAVADAFDVMTAARSYRQPIGREAALRELGACSGTHFDPRAVRAMLAVSTPRLRWAMGPLSWLGAAPFLAASQGAAAVAAQATAGALVVGSVVVAGQAPVASASAPPAAVARTGGATTSATPGPADPGAGPRQGGGPAPGPSTAPSPRPSTGPPAPIPGPQPPQPTKPPQPPKPPKVQPPKPTKPPRTKGAKGTHPKPTKPAGAQLKSTKPARP